MNAYELLFGKNIINFTQQGYKFDLRIDNESFSYVYFQIRQLRHFFIKMKIKRITLNFLKILDRFRKSYIF